MALLHITVSHVLSAGMQLQTTTENHKVESCNFLNVTANPHLHHASQVTTAGIAATAAVLIRELLAGKLFSRIKELQDTASHWVCHYTLMSDIT